MDITVASDMENWSKCYDRKALGEYVDYLVLMAYDEHGRLSKTAGSVASLNWVENGVKDLTEQVPSEKIILEFLCICAYGKKIMKVMYQLKP